MARKASPQAPPIGARPSVRRWSSHTIAGRSGVPFSSATTSVTRCVVSATPATRSDPTADEPHSLRHASPIAVHQTSGSCSAQPGWGETYGSIGARPIATSSPRGSKRMARTLWVPTSIARAWSAAPPAATAVWCLSAGPQTAGCGSVGRPRDRRPVRVGAGKAPGVEELGDSRSRGFDLLERQELAERDGERSQHGALPEAVADAPKRGRLLRLEGLALPGPQDRPQLRLDGEGDPVVH